MEKGVWKILLFQSIILVCFGILWFFMQQYDVKSTAKTISNQTKSLDGILADCSGYLQISKAKNELYQVSIEQDYMNRKAVILLETYSSFQVHPVSDNDSIIKIVGQETSTTGKGKVEIRYNVELDGIYVMDSVQDEENIYVRVFIAKKRYEKIVVIDPGHGGMDSGTQSEDGKAKEKDINLLVAMQLKEMFEQDADIKVLFTREEDVMLTPEKRAAFINEADPDICVSIHCNSGENPDANGAEVLYNPKMEEEGITSEILAENCLNQFVKTTGRNNRGLVDGNNIYIIHKSNVPIALFELGFMSNSGDLEYLLDSGNQKKMAMGIYKGIKETLNQLN